MDLISIERAERKRAELYNSIWFWHNINKRFTIQQPAPVKLNSDFANYVNTIRQTNRKD